MFLWFKNKYWFTIFLHLALNYFHTFNSYYWKTYDFIQEQLVCRNIYLRTESKLILSKILSMHIALHELKFSINRDYKLESSWTMKVWEIPKWTQQFKHSINAIFIQNNKQKFCGISFGSTWKHQSKHTQQQNVLWIFCVIK